MTNTFWMTVGNSYFSFAFQLMDNMTSTASSELQYHLAINLIESIIFYIVYFRSKLAINHIH